MILYLLLFCGVLLGTGYLVDLWYKKHGVENVDPEENAKHVSESERAYIESHLHNVKSNQDNGL